MTMGTMGRAAFVKGIFRPIVNWGRKVYRNRWPPNPVLPFADMFPTALRHNFRPADTVTVPHEAGFPAYHERYLAENKERYVSEHCLKLPDDYVAILPGATFCPMNNAVMNSDKRLLKESYIPRLKDCPYQYPLYMERRLEVVEGYATPFRATWPAYFHVFVDALPRLLALTSPPFSDLDKIQLLCPTPPTPLERYLAERIAPPNCTFRVLEDPNRLCTVEHLIFTPFKATGGYVRREYLEELRRRLLPDRPSNRCRRILIARAHWPGSKRHVSNMKALEEALSVWGFETLCTEEMSVEAEIAAFYDAEVIVGAHGSGLTNMIFSQHTAVVELFATRTFWPVFYELSSALGHEYRYVMGKGEDLYPTQYEVDIRAVRDHVKQLLSQ